MKSVFLSPDPSNIRTGEGGGVNGELEGLSYGLADSRNQKNCNQHSNCCSIVLVAKLLQRWISAHRTSFSFHQSILKYDYCWIHNATARRVLIPSFMLSQSYTPSPALQVLHDTSCSRVKGPTYSSSMLYNISCQSNHVQGQCHHHLTERWQRRQSS